MKKEVQFIFLFMLLIVSMPLLIAENETTDMSRVNEAYSCLRNQIDEKGCDTLALEEQIFSVLSVGKCKTNLLEAADDDECWPNGNCDIKLTAQSILALKERGTTYDGAKDWLLDQTKHPTNMDWYLQIE